MINLETFFRNHFDSESITDNHIKKFVQVHIQRLMANNPGNKYAQMINDTVGAYDGYYGSIEDEDLAQSLQESRSIIVDSLFAAFISNVSMKEGIIRGTWGKNSPEYELFFRHGLDEYHQASKTDIEPLMNRMIQYATQYVAELGQPFVDLFTQLKQDYVAARAAQLNQIGVVIGDKTKTAATRDVVEIQLMKNLLLLAVDYVGQPDMVNDYFDQSIIPKWASGGSGSGDGGIPAILETIVFSSKQNPAGAVSMSLIGADGEQVLFKWKDGTADTSVVVDSVTFVVAMHLYSSIGNYNIEATGVAAAFKELLAPDCKLSAINIPDTINFRRIDLNNNLLISFFLPASCTDLIDIQLNNNELDQASVNALLIMIESFGSSNGSISIVGGSNAAPSGQGLAAMNQLIARGWNVITN